MSFTNKNVVFAYSSVRWRWFVARKCLGKCTHKFNLYVSCFFIHWFMYANFYWIRDPRRTEIWFYIYSCISLESFKEQHTSKFKFSIMYKIFLLHYKKKREVEGGAFCLFIIMGCYNYLWFMSYAYQSHYLVLSNVILQ